MNAVGKVSKGRSGTAAGKAANPPKKITAGRQNSKVGGSTRGTAGGMVAKGTGTTKGAAGGKVMNSGKRAGAIKRGGKK
jgi:hypothetical protein